jgi:AAA15 family ATPase/GTPase
MHLKSLHIQNFRSLEDFKVSKLGRINLIVGKNNSGKSSVLEALRIYAANAHPAVLEEIASGHDERFRLKESDSVDDSFDLPFEHFFTGRIFPLDDSTKISIGELENNSSKLTIEHCLIKANEATSEKYADDRALPNFYILNKYDAVKNDINYESEALLVSKNETSKFINFNTNPIRRNRFWFEASEAFSSSYIPTQFISMDELANIWDTIQFSDHGNFIREGLKFIENDFENIAFIVNNEVVGNTSSLISNNVARKFGIKRTAIVKLKNQTKAIPLNSMGDGMVRVLQLLLKVYPAKGGFLLIDEFENGLHYSVQEKIWQFLFDLAEKLDIQVFATTHSWDCIESFAKVAVENTQSEGVLFRVGRSMLTSNQGMVIATVFDEKQLLNITQADVEVR